MRTMMKVTVPVGPGNRAVGDGSLAQLIEEFVERMKPEASYFLTDGGRRHWFFVFDMQDSSLLPSLAEPFFNELDASIELSPVMNLEDLRKGIAQATKQNGRKRDKAAGRAIQAQSK